MVNASLAALTPGYMAEDEDRNESRDMLLPYAWSIVAMTRRRE